MKYILTVTFFIFGSIAAKDFGKSGTTFPVAEESLLDSMKSKAALHESQLKIYAEKIENHIQNPPPIEGIGNAIERRSWIYDPAWLVEEDIRIDGELILKAGTKVNPLEKMELPGGMLFFDGSDSDQVDWARKEPSDFKWVLVTGSPVSLELQEKRPCYYDQLGLLTTRFQIKNVPAKVFQEGNFLRIEEIPTTHSTDKNSRAPAFRTPPGQLQISDAAQETFLQELKTKNCPACISQPVFGETYLKIFMSVSVPLQSWKDFSTHLEQTGGTFVLKGLPQDSIELLSKFILELQSHDVNAPIDIDPAMFEKYQIDEVPAIILEHESRSDRMIGNIRLDAALREIAEKGDAKSKAKELLQRLSFQ